MISYLDFSFLIILIIIFTFSVVFVSNWLRNSSRFIRLVSLSMQILLISLYRLSIPLNVVVSRMRNFSFFGVRNKPLYTATENSFKCYLTYFKQGIE